ncbi:hypothetical protein HK099_004500 [Clydaea vesicula]|uniref:CAP-Gly domain-containing protein n=1 Tax=Clydaea vesicula TaxID=447962 RepID=A0AAD5U6W4_9FUNG|nr:hypothetical protein HK099_004500 [Clydaea vesicula]
MLLFDRIFVDGHYGTIKFRGPVPPDSNTDWYGIEWDDPTRGKHSGIHNNIKYFETSVENSGSFIKTSKNGIKFGIDFLSALSEKYTPNLNLQDTILKFGEVKSNQIEVETIGWEKVLKKLADVNKLKEVGLSNSFIKYKGSKNLDTVLKMVNDLDLSKNLFNDFVEVATITKELKTLISLRLNYNKFKPLSQFFVNNEFENIKILGLNNTKLSWFQMEVLARSLTNLEELHFGFNELKSFKFEDQETNCFLKDPTFCKFLQLEHECRFQKLRLLNLESNSINDFKDIIWHFGKLKNLKSLNLKSNKIKKIEIEKQIEEVKNFPNLTFINLNENLIDDWISVDNLNYFEKLTEIRFKNNPILTTLDASESLFTNLTARLSRATHINGSLMTEKDRYNSELYYLSKISKEYYTLMYENQKMNEAELNSVKSKFFSIHPILPYLESKHGKQDDLTNLNVNVKESKILRNRLLDLSFKFKNHDVKKKLVPPSTKLRNFKSFCLKLFKSEIEAENINKKDITLKFYEEQIEEKNLKEKQTFELNDDLRDLEYFNLKSGCVVIIDFKK